MIWRTFGLTFLLASTACTGSASPDTPSLVKETPIEVETDHELDAKPEIQIDENADNIEEQDDVSFEEVLEEFQSLNSRLEQVAYRLQKANMELCPRWLRDPGFTVHTATDYPESIRTIARALLPVSDGVSIRSVREGSSAHDAGLKTGDELVKLGTAWMPRGKSAAKFFRLNRTDLLIEDQLSVTVMRGSEELTKTISPETICRYPVNLFFSEHVNGHTDGDEVWITSELLRTVPDDVNLALVVAHEMAHAIEGHVEEYPSKSLELIADRMALIMMERAGYDIDRAISYWANAAHPHGQGNASRTHPSISDRLDHFQAVRDHIRQRQLDGLPLNFD